MFHSIRWRIAVPFAFLILLTMVGLGFYLSAFTHQTYVNRLETELSAEARLAGDLIAGQLSGASPNPDLDAIAARWASILNGRVTILDAGGNVLGESDAASQDMENHLDRPEIQAALQAGEGSSTRASETTRVEMMYTARALYRDDQLIGFIRLARSLDSIEAQISRLQRTLIGATALITLLSVLLATWIAGRTTHPLRRLTEAAQQMSAGKPTGYILPVSEDEVGQLTRAFNQMSSQLSRQIDALEGERSKLARVLSEMTDGVLIVGESGEVQLINRAAENMFGVQQYDALRHSLAEVVRQHQVVDLWQRSLASGETEATTIEIPARQMYLQAVAAPFGGSPTRHTLLLIQDLTRLRRLETVRRDFISNISHELRTPLASLKALTETLQEGALEDPEAARRFLQMMETEVDSLTLMVAEILELSRIESGLAPFQMKRTQPARLIEAAVQRLYLQAERAGLQIHLECQAHLPPILVDPPRLEQVIVNLIHNAIKFTHSGGHIWVRARPEGENLLITVQDTGIGIPSEDLSRIFERFFKSDRARASGGTGLGLAIARHTVEAHGGKIWAESRNRQGAVFYILLPWLRE